MEEGEGLVSRLRAGAEESVWPYRRLSRPRSRPTQAISMHTARGEACLHTGRGEACLHTGLSFRTPGAAHGLQHSPQTGGGGDGVN